MSNMTRRVRNYMSTIDPMNSPVKIKSISWLNNKNVNSRNICSFTLSIPLKWIYRLIKVILLIMTRSIGMYMLTIRNDINITRRASLIHTKELLWKVHPCVCSRYFAAVQIREKCKDICVLRYRCPSSFSLLILLRQSLFVLMVTYL